MSRGLYYCRRNEEFVRSGFGQNPGVVYDREVDLTRKGSVDVPVKRVTEVHSEFSVQESLRKGPMEQIDQSRREDFKR